MQKSVWMDRVLSKIAMALLKYENNRLGHYNTINEIS